MSDSQQPSEKGLIIAPPAEIVENDLPFVKIPNGYPPEDKIRVVLNKENEPTEEELARFFTPEMLRRLIICPKINVDETDDVGMFGYEPGYIFINEVNYKGSKTASDEGMLTGANSKDVVTEGGISLLVVPHYDFFPRDKYGVQFISARRTPRTFRFLNGLIKPEEILKQIPETGLQKDWVGKISKK